MNDTFAERLSHKVRAAFKNHKTEMLIAFALGALAAYVTTTVI